MINPRITAAIPSVAGFLKHCERKCFRSRSTLVRAGEASESFFLVLKGTLAVIIDDDDEHTLILNYVNPGEFFGEVGLFRERDKTRYATVIAKSACEIAQISYDKFRRIRHQHPDIIFAIGIQMAERLEQTTMKLRDHIFVDVKGRISKALTQLCQQPDAMTHPEGMQLKVSRQELSRLAGCSREVAGRMIKLLQEEGLIRVKGHTMLVFDRRQAAQ